MPNGSDLQARMIDHSERAVDAWAAATEQVIGAWRDTMKMWLTFSVSLMPYSPIAEAIGALSDDERRGDGQRRTGSAAAPR